MLTCTKHRCRSSVPKWLCFGRDISNPMVDMWLPTSHCVHSLMGPCCSVCQVQGWSDARTMCYCMIVSCVSFSPDDRHKAPNTLLSHVWAVKRTSSDVYSPTCVESFYFIGNRSSSQYASGRSALTIGRSERRAGDTCGIIGCR